MHITRVTPFGRALAVVALGLAALATATFAVPSAHAGPAAPAFSCAAVTAIPQAECQALVSLYTATGGPGWHRRDGWLASNNPCTWYGVGCAGGRVVTLLLTLNGLTGTLPADLDRLTEVSTLALDHNSLTGAFPLPVTRLTKLELLELDNNQLAGPVPPEIGNLTRLRTLDLDTNRLTALPPEIGRLQSLLAIDLQGNQLTGPLPKELGDLRKLQVLNVMNNPLTGRVPTTLQGLPLTGLLFANTKLCEPDTAEFRAWLASIPTVLGTGVRCMLGGRDLRLTAGASTLAWATGTEEAGFRVYRQNVFTGAMTTMPSGPALPAGTSTFTDTSGVVGGAYCYFVTPVDAAGKSLGTSDALCTETGKQSGAVVPVEFRIGLNQSPIATLTWKPPAGGADAYTLTVLPLAPLQPTVTHFNGAATGTAYDTRGFYHCFLLTASRAGGLTGRTDALCALPGASTLGQPSGAGAMAGEAAVQRALRITAEAAEGLRRHLGGPRALARPPEVPPPAAP